MCKYITYDIVEDAGSFNNLSSKIAELSQVQFELLNYFRDDSFFKDIRINLLSNVGGIVYTIEDEEELTMIYKLLEYKKLKLRDKLKQQLNKQLKGVN